MQYQLDYLELPSSDGKATGAFMSAAFGWSLVPYGPDYLGVEEAGIALGIDGAVDRPAAPLPVIRTQDLDGAQAAVLAAGAEITKPQFDFPGGRRFECRAPGGLVLAVWVAKP